jgi:hypothetical protein
MAKANSKQPGGWQRIWFRAALGVMSLLLFAAFIAVLRDLVERDYAVPPTAPRLVLANQPVWMTQALAEQIVDSARPVGIHSVFDRPLLVETAKALSANPWIKEVRQVRRTFVQGPGDTLQVDCVYRVPTALVQWQGYYWLVDGDGYRLPERYTSRELAGAMIGPDGKLMLRIINGITRAPVLSGKPWPGDDLAAGLELVKLLANKPYAEDIPVVDVSNFGGRRDSQAAQLVLMTRYNTAIRWGRPPSAKDYFVEVPASQKLQDLSDIFQQMHRVDGGQPWIDIRFDQVTYPSPQPAADGAGPKKDTGSPTARAD